MTADGAVVVDGYLDTQGPRQTDTAGDVTISGFSVSINGNNSGISVSTKGVDDGRASPRYAGGEISITATGGNVDVAGGFDASGCGKGSLTISATSGSILLDSLDLSLVGQVSLLASPTTVEIDALTTLDTDWSGGTVGSGDFTGFYDVSSDVYYDPASSPGLTGTYTIDEQNGDGDAGFDLIPEPGSAVLVVLGLPLVIRRRRRR